MKEKMVSQKDAIINEKWAKKFTNSFDFKLAFDLWISPFVCMVSDLHSDEYIISIFPEKIIPPKALL